MPLFSKRLEDYETVRTWLRGFREQWGTDPLEEDPSRLDVLRRFCEFVGKEPDAVIRECILIKGGEKRISFKGRRLYSEKIAEFQDTVAGDARERARQGNTVRSFLIHNGILLQAGLQLS